MLQNTKALIAYILQDKNKHDFNVIRAMVHAIVCCGSTADAAALLPVFLSNPGDREHALLLPVLAQFGNTQIAEMIFSTCTTGQRLHQGVEESVLEVLGTLQYEPAKPMLVYYALEQEPYDYYLSKHAVLGLLYLDVNDIKPAIQSSIEKCYEKNLFPEFVPALVCKLDNPQQQEVLQKLYELGETTASTDCIAGIVLGFSLSGASGEAYFWKALFKPFWEVGLSSTGTRYFTYRGLQNLGITFQQFYQKIKALDDPTVKQYALEIMLDMLQIKAEEPVIKNQPGETISAIYTYLFGSENSSESSTLTDLAEKLDKADDTAHIEKLLALKMKEEMILQNLWALQQSH